MRVVLVLATVLLALPAAAADEVHLAAPGFTTVNVSPEAGELYNDYFAQRLARGGLRVTTQAEVAALLGMERQRQLLGCSDDASSCLAELGGALGADALVLGRVGRTPSGYVATVRVVASRDGRLLGRADAQPRDDDALFQWLDESARRLAPEVRRGLGREPVPFQEDVFARNRLRVGAPYFTLEYAHGVTRWLWLGVRGGGTFATLIPPFSADATGLGLHALVHLEPPTRGPLAYGFFFGGGGGYSFGQYYGEFGGAELLLGAEVRFHGVGLSLETLFGVPGTQVGNTTMSPAVRLLPSLSFTHAF